MFPHLLGQNFGEVCQRTVEKDRKRFKAAERENKDGERTTMQNHIMKRVVDIHLLHSSDFRGICTTFEDFLQFCFFF